MSLYIKRISSSIFPTAILGSARFVRPFLELFKFSLLPLKKYFFFLVSLSMALAMLYVSKTSPPALGPVQNLFLEASGKIRLSFSGLTNQLAALKQMIWDYREMLDSKRRLELENAELHSRLVSLISIQQENEALRQVLSMVPDLPQRTVTVPVISSPLKGWNHCFLIAAGYTSGIQKGQPVLSPYGVVGQIEIVSDHVARVMPLTHQGSRIPVKGLASGVEAILAGDGTPTPFLIYVRDNQVLENDEIWVTSRHGGRFPPGHRVGYLGQQLNGMRLVNPYIPWHNLGFVQVVTGLPLQVTCPSGQSL